MVHSHSVHLPLGALLSPCTMCGTGAQPGGGYTYYHIWQVLNFIGGLLLNIIDASYCCLVLDFGSTAYRQPEMAQAVLAVVGTPVGTPVVQQPGGAGVQIGRPVTVECAPVAVATPAAAPGNGGTGGNYYPRVAPPTPAPGSNYYPPTSPLCNV